MELFFLPGNCAVLFDRKCLQWPAKISSPALNKQAFLPPCRTPLLLSKGKTIRVFGTPTHFSPAARLMSSYITVTWSKTLSRITDYFHPAEQSQPLGGGDIQREPFNEYSSVWTGKLLVSVIIPHYSFSFCPLTTPGWQTRLGCRVLRPLAVLHYSLSTSQMLFFLSLLASRHGGSLFSSTPWRECHWTVAGVCTCVCAYAGKGDSRSSTKEFADLTWCIQNLLNYSGRFAYILICFR